MYPSESLALTLFLAGSDPVLLEIPATFSNVTAEIGRRIFINQNCAGCHRPGGARASFDARFETPLNAAGILDGKLQTGNLEIENARVVVPGDPGRSVLLQRMQRLDTFRMPPLGRYYPDRHGTRLIRKWIESLGK